MTIKYFDDYRVSPKIMQDTEMPIVDVNPEIGDEIFLRLGINDVKVEYVFGQWTITQEGNNILFVSKGVQK